MGQQLEHVSPKAGGGGGDTHLMILANDADGLLHSTNPVFLPSRLLPHQRLGAQVQFL